MPKSTKKFPFSNFSIEIGWLLENDYVEADLNATLEHSRLPIIAAVNGYAFGGGAVLALACDIRMASKKARFGFPEVKVGAFASGSGTQRLPGLVGPGLRKNVIYDFLNDNNLDAIDSRGVFQFYPMVNLWKDIEVGLDAGLRLLHLTAAPISVAEVAREGFGRDFDQEIAPSPAQYDLRSRYASLFGVEGQYQYSKRETLLAVRAYAQSEPRKRES